MSEKPASRRERQRLETRSRLFEAALDEFRRVGFTKAQIDKIVEQAGVARGTFYFHFPTKEHVLMELQRRQEEEIVASLRDAVRAQRPDGVKAFLRLLLQAMADAERAVGDPALVREVVAMYARAPRYVDLSSEPFVVALVDFFGDAAESGALRDDLTPEEITQTFLNMLFAFMIRDDEDVPDPERFEAALDIFVRGIQPIRPDAG